VSIHARVNPFILPNTSASFGTAGIAFHGLLLYTKRGGFMIRKHKTLGIYLGLFFFLLLLLLGINTGETLAIL